MSVEDLVAAAAKGDQDAWSRLVHRYSPLILSVIRGYRLSAADSADVYQTVWLRLVEHLDRLRDPVALPMWLTTTARRECLRLVQAGRRTRPFDPLDEAAQAPDVRSTLVDDAPVDADLLRAERRQALRDAFAQLPGRCQDLLGMLMADPPLRYQEISERLGIPMGSVGPTQARCLRKLRACPAMVAFVASLRAAEGREDDRDDVAALG
ncbi:MAG TPA: sigma-70 family RNA polymerase sigma factor [Rugosimonospora sp.]|nr:sigma-70 family RNA polymerase sigma factor [Rugosimonospora sp.]